MDGTTVEQSDSDSGESWTLLENSPTYAVDAPDYPENAVIPTERENEELYSERDEDTDGISIISDSDPESAPCEANYINLSTTETRPEERENAPLLASQPATNNNPNNESVRVDTDFLGDKVKCKTYVHRRNPKVSAVLDIIMLGTFVITAGMALGHLWSCKNEYTTQTSVNKILSNLYKLQEENAYLRNKLKEMTQVTTNPLLHQGKSTISKQANKLHKCKKIFEEPVITNNKIEATVTCVDDNKPDTLLHAPLETPEHEKELLSDIDKMKDIYNQNKKWLDKEVKKQFDDNANLNSHGKAKHINLEKRYEPTFFPSNHVPPDVIQDTHKQFNDEKDFQIPMYENNFEKQLGPIHYNIPHKKVSHGKDDGNIVPNKEVQSQQDINMEIGLNQNTSPPNLDFQSDPFEMIPEKKITYADSLKIGQPSQKNKISGKNNKPSKWVKDYVGKKKFKDNDLLLNLNSYSEDDIKKDDRYTEPKIKSDKKKHDRQKSHKKQKRNNKYEQWEMKGGYLKDFDDLSVTSSLDNDISIKNKADRKFLNPDFENYINKFIEAENNASNKDQTNIKMDEKLNKLEKRHLKSDKGKRAKPIFWNPEWYDQRSALRAEARMKLEHELFGENISNNAGWYFRRMQKREQCRAQKNNSTFKKISKQKMNFKMKR